MYPRTEYEMTEADLKAIYAACKAVPYMVIGGHAPSSPQENANRAWQSLGQKMGFDHMTVRPISGKGERFFTAIPSETAEQREARETRELQAKRQERIAILQSEIEGRQRELDALNAEADQSAAIAEEEGKS